MTLPAYLHSVHTTQHEMRIKNEFLPVLIYFKLLVLNVFPFYLGLHQEKLEQQALAFKESMCLQPTYNEIIEQWLKSQKKYFAALHENPFSGESF